MNGASQAVHGLLDLLRRRVHDTLFQFPPETRRVEWLTITME
jgi:hypothetical protein